MSKTTQKTPKDQAARDLITGANPEGLGRNLFVRAGAGAGKTHCIMERVKNLLVGGELKPAKLAVITYTVKAAAELKERIRFELERAQAIELLDELNQARISTVHSFCYDLLREFPVEFGIDPSCEIADERRSAIVHREVVRRFFEAQALGDPRFAQAFERHSKLASEFGDAVSDDALFGIFQTLYRNRELKAIPVDGGSPEELKRLREAACRHLADLIQAFDREIEEQIRDESDKLYQKRGEILKTYQQQGGKLEELLSFILKTGKNLFPGNAGSQGNYRSREFLKALKEKISAFRGTLEMFQQERVAGCYRLILESYPVYARLHDEYKREHSLLDFADCLILMRDRLRDHEFLRVALQQRFDRLIIDEFQDSDPLQSEILFHLASEDAEPGTPWDMQKLVPGKLVFVGDPKQSIYGFSRADISIYLRVMSRLIQADEKSDVVLFTNFRSNRDVVALVNECFSRIIRPHPDEPFASPEYEPMHAYNEAAGKRPDCQRLQLTIAIDGEAKRPEEYDKKGNLREPEKRRREAWAIANLIKAEIEEGRADGPGDFLILFRKGAGMADYEWALERLGVPVINTRTSAFLALPEVISLVSVAGVLVHPEEPHYLYAALRSIYLGYDDQELRELFRRCGKEVSLGRLTELEPGLKPLFDAVKAPAPLPARFEQACRSLEIFSTAGALGDESLLSSITKLAELIRSELALNAFDEAKTIESFLRAALPEQTGRPGSGEEDLGDDKLVLRTLMPTKVRLMTIHGAKGLESRYVILANPGADQMDKVDVLMDREKETIVPLGIKAGQAKLADYPSLAQPMARERVFKQAEERRVLYVAATRAREKLWICAYEGEEAGSFLAPLMDVLPGKIPAVEVKLSHDYQDRHKLSGKSTKLAPARLDRPEFERRQRESAQKLNQRTHEGASVTGRLKEEAAEVFGDNPDGRERGKELGTLLHAVMERICRRAGAGAGTTAEEATVILRQLNSGYRFEPQLLAELEQGVHAFLESERYSRIRGALEIFVEVPFQIAGDLHGIMDLVFRDSDGIHIIDWKSDVFSTPRRKERVSSYYKKQIAAYSAAVSSAMGETAASAECVYLLDGIASAPWR